MNNTKAQYPSHPRFWDTHKRIWWQEYDKLDYEGRFIVRTDPNGWVGSKMNDRVVRVVKKLLHIKDEETE